MLKKILIVAIPLTLVIVLVYDYLGGFNETAISLVESEDYVVAGYVYRGPYRQSALQDLFFRVQDFVESGTLVGRVTVLNYQFDIAAQDSVHQLIGVRLDNLPLNLPEGITIDTVRADKVVRATIRAHPLVMPNPEDTQQKILDFARQASLDLADLVLEQYVGEEEIWVDVPLR